MISIRHYTTKFSKLANGQRFALISLTVFSILLPVLSLLVMQKINFVAYAGIEGPLPITPPITPPTQNYITQTFNWEPGFNTLGITINRILWYGGAGKIKILGGGFPQYRASDLLWDLNNSFVTVPPKPFKMGGGGYPIEVIYHYNANRGIWEYYTAYGYGNNFPVSPGEGYFVKSSMRGASAITGLQVLTNIYIPIPQYWSIISLPENTGLTNAESLLQRMINQGINVDMVVKWDNTRGRYSVYQTGFPNNFQLVPGEGYWIRNSGEAKTFIPSNTAAGSASVQVNKNMRKLPKKLPMSKKDVKKMTTPPALPKIKIK